MKVFLPGDMTVLFMFLQYFKTFFFGQVHCCGYLDERTTSRSAARLAVTEVKQAGKEHNFRQQFHPLLNFV